MSLELTSDERRIGEDVVHLWHVPLCNASSDVDLLLSKDEQQRAKRFRFDKDRHRFVLCRAALRRILGEYLTTDPSDIQLCYNDFGKPQLEESSVNRSLNFNVSQSGSIGLIAVTRADRVGVDVEQLINLHDVESLAGLCLSRRELARFHLVAAQCKSQLFINLWTCKEAMAKADGRGLSLPLSEIEFAFSENAVTKATSIAGNQAAASRWSLTQFIPASGYVGAVALESSGPTIKHMQYSALADAG